MSERLLPSPHLPLPPSEYDPRQQSAIVRAVSTLYLHLRNPGEGRHTKMTLTNLPDNGVGLEAGALYQVDGVVHIALIDRAVPVGESMTASVGSVSVVT